MKTFISILLILIPTLIFGIFQMPVQMTISLFAGFASAMILNIEKFDYFKAGQLEAKLREADKVIAEANATIEQLRSVAEPLLNSNLLLLIYDGVIDGIKISEKEEILQELLTIKDEINLNDDHTNELISNAKNSIAFFHFMNIKLELPGDISVQKLEFFDKYSTMDTFPSFPSVKEVEDFLLKILNC